MTIYDEMQGIAKEIFAEFGQGIISYVSVTPGTGPGDNPGAATEIPYQLAGATARGVSFKFVQSGLALATDLQVAMPVDNRFTLDMKGFIVIDGKRLKIVQIMQKPAAGTPVAYVAIVRK